MTLIILVSDNAPSNLVFHSLRVTQYPRKTHIFIQTWYWSTQRINNGRRISQGKQRDFNHNLGFELTRYKSPFDKQRAAKDNAEIKKLADSHFKQRAEDDAKVKELEERIAKTLKARESAKAERASIAAEKERKLQEAKEAAEKAEEDRQAAEKAKQAEVLAGQFHAPFLTVETHLLPSHVGRLR